MAINPQTAQMLGQLFARMAQQQMAPSASPTAAPAAAPAMGGGGDPKGKGKRPMPPAYINQMRLPSDMADAMYRERGAPPTPVSPGFRFVPNRESDPAYSLGIEIAQEGLSPYKDAYASAFKQAGGNAYKSNELMSENYPYSYSGFGTGARPYGEVMSAAYGEAGTKRIIEQLRALYEANKGGSLAAVDLTKPIQAKGMTPADRHENAKAIENPEHGVLVNMPELSKLIDFSKTAVGKNDRKDAVRSDISDTVREELIHSTRRSAGREIASGVPKRFDKSANPLINTLSLPPLDELSGEPVSYSPWERYVRANTVTGGRYKDSAAMAGAAEEGTIRDPSKFYVAGSKPFFAPLFEKAPDKPLDPYRGSVEEIRAKLVKTAQTLGYHPLMHPEGLNAGVDELLRRIGQRGVQAGLVRDETIVSPPNSAMDPEGEHPEMSDPMYYFGMYNRLKEDPSKAKELESMRQLLLQVFKNWAAGPVNGDALGISLPEASTA